MSPKKAKRGSAASPISVQTSQGAPSVVSDTDSPPYMAQPPADLSQFAVPQTFIQRFPPRPDAPGWKMKKWYVVVKGKVVGIHYDYW
jgi:hypothetical protein